MLILLSAFFLLGCFQKQFAQNQIKAIAYDYKLLSSVTTTADHGNLYPISKNKSFINLGYIKLGILDNATGKIEKEFDEETLRIIIDSVIKYEYNGIYSIPEREENMLVPFCQKYPFRYERFFEIPGVDKYVCQITCTVKKNEDPTVFNLINGIGFFDENLVLKEFISAGRNNDGSASLIMGGFFYNKHTFFARRDNPMHESKFDYVLFRNKNGNRYEKIGDVMTIPKTELPVYFPGRFFSTILVGSKYYINTGTKLFQTTDMSQQGTEIPLPINSEECLAILEKMSNKKFIGLKIKLDKEGSGISGVLFKTNDKFKDFQKIKEYDFIKYNLNSLKVLDNEVYILLFDRENEKFMLEKID